MSILYKLNKYSGTFLFKTPNTITYSIFNYLYNKFIINLEDADDDIKFFHEKGYLKPNINFKEEVLQLKDTLNENNKIESKSKFKYHLNNNSIDKIKNIINSSKFLNLINKIEKYFNLKIYLIDVTINRNFPINSEIEHSENVYSNNYHVDYYIMNFFKMFINLHDVDQTQGPMNFYSKKDTKKFIKFNNYKDRSNYNIKNEKDLGLVKNIGSAGDILVCSTPQCLHRASSPDNGKFRDMLFLSFAVTSENESSSNGVLSFEKDHFNDIWKNSGILPKKLCKPKSARQQVSMFRNFMKYKIRH
tara:strand:+ start:5338 stop:6246 length:909 start_codon:yes stop_codon:yes gene_type:complete